MRDDSLGLFWRDEPVIKIKKEIEKKEPPKKVWLEPGYLPHYKTVHFHKYNLISHEELAAHNEIPLLQRDKLVFDTETYLNYFLVAFRFITSGKIIYFEKTRDSDLDFNLLKWVVENFTIIGFNSKAYDSVILSLALAGKPIKDIKEASDMLIALNMNASDVLNHFKTKRFKFNHIDLIEVAKGKASLKLYGGRIHTRLIQDLPFPPDRVLNIKEIEVLRWYCIESDLSSTFDLYKELENQINLRSHMGTKHNLELRSKSDAQMAESVIGSALKKQTGYWPAKREFVEGETFRYRIPEYLKFKSDLLNWVLNSVRNFDFTISEFGRVIAPQGLLDLKIPINNSTYQMGIGGLHSCEKSISHYSDDKHILVDRDVASYYPNIILNQQLFPRQLGTPFLEVYRDIVNDRLKAKKDKDTVVNECLKIVINGSFGKLGSPYSLLYSPELLVQVTVTGQLSLLMLIESLELNHIPVVSANTDGLVIKCPRDMYSRMDSICNEWEKITNFTLEETKYRSVHSRDVNNYIAIKKDGSPKAKGAYAKPTLEKNPANSICVEAITKYLVGKIPFEKTIVRCEDIRKFLTVRTVAGGAVKVNENSTDYLGKAIRWYYGKNETGYIIYAKSGNTVPRSEGGVPLMTLPSTLPSDINYEWYVNECHEILNSIGLTQ